MMFTHHESKQSQQQHKTVTFVEVPNHVDFPLTVYEFPSEDIQYAKSAEVSRLLSH